MKYYNDRPGWIEIICGPMFAGKTEELIRRVRRMDFAKKNYVIFKPSIDNRYSETEVVSHNQKKVQAICISHIADMKKCITEEVQAVIIDEVQFFEPAIIPFIQELADSGLRVICAGLDSDFRGKPFEISSHILAIAEKITKLTAICSVCGNEATRTQRIINGKPASYNDPTILVGEMESYEPRCRCCHKVVRHDL